MVDTGYLPAPLERAELTFSGRTLAVLRDMVLSGRVRPGERLNEVEIANALGISRGPLREAIQHLRSEGLLTTVSQRGAYVRTFTSAELGELYEVRIALESHALRLAADKSKGNGIADLRQLMVETNQAVDKNARYPIDMDFHQRIVLLADNQALFDAVVEVHRKISLARSRSGQVPQRARTALSEHEAVLDHLAMGKGELAVKVLTAHLRSSLENALLIFQTDEAEI